MVNNGTKAYKIIDTAYNAATNNVTHAWNSDFAAYFEGTAYGTVESFSALTDDSDDLKALLANLPRFIVDNNIDPVNVQTVTDGTATFADLAMGEYFIIPSSSTSVYQLMLQKVQPIKPANTTDPYKIDDVTFAAKHKEVNITKAADKTSVTKGEKVTYTLTVDIPTYSDEALDKTFSVSDKMADGLTLDAASIKLTIDGTDVSDTAYTLSTTATDDYTFIISVDNDKYAVVLTDPFDPDAYPITDGEYDELLAFDDVMAYIEISSINVYLPIYHGTDEGTLQIGVGHLENTSLPIGGKSTHAVLSAHRGLPSARLFTDLNLLKKGNIFRIYVLDEVLSYQVYDIETVNPDDSSSLHIKKDEDIVTLITCTPYGQNTHRLLVHGKRIEEKEDTVIEEPQIEKTMTWEDYATLAAVCISVVFLLLLLFSAVKAFFRRKKKNEKAD